MVFNHEVLGMGLQSSSDLTNLPVISHFKSDAEGPREGDFLWAINGQPILGK